MKKGKDHGLSPLNDAAQRSSAGFQPAIAAFACSARAVKPSRS